MKARRTVAQSPRIEWECSKANAMILPAHQDVTTRPRPSNDDRASRKKTVEAHLSCHRVADEEDLLPCSVFFFLKNTCGRTHKKHT